MLDQDTLAKLPDNVKGQLADYETMFVGKGWGHLVKYLRQTAKEAHERAFMAQSWDEFNLWRTRWYCYEEMAKFQESTYKEFETLADIPEEDRLPEFDISIEDMESQLRKDNPDAFV